MSIRGELCAQTIALKAEYERMSDKTYATFNMNKFAIRHRHIVFLERENKMIIEMSTLDDYDILSDIGKVLKDFRANLSFYKDSLNSLDTKNIRIDYQTSVPESNVKIRFKSYSPDGDIYAKTKNSISKLKTAQDTIRIKINKTVEQKAFNRLELDLPYRSVMITLLLNNCTDIDDLIADKEILQHSIDTMAAAAQPKTKKKGWDYTWFYQTTIFYHPYMDRYKALWKYDYLTDPIYGMEPILPRHTYHNTVAPNLNIGISLLRSKIAPIANIGLEYRRYWKKDENDYTIFGLYTEPYFLFSKGSDAKFHTYVNWFINAEVGENHGKNNDVGYYVGSKTTTMGVGYLVNPDGLYLKGTTMKAFIDITFKGGITVAPEIISTNNFHTIYPSLSVKIFDIR